eukprot:gene24407-32853_t
MKSEDVSIKTHLCSAYVVIVAAFLFGNWLPSYTPTEPGDPWSNVGITYLTCYSYLTASCTLCLTVISVSCARMDAIETKSTLSVKQMFMRYISHEMRTPLNVACLGMKILHDELKRLGLLSLLETAMDTQKACQTSIDILNDLLLYDKIASGLMTLEKRLLDPLDFTTKVLRPFNLQARETGIDLQLEPSAALTSLTTSVRLLVDPYKIAQVIRNLVSNALKFTSPNGSVRLLLSVDGGIEGSDSGDADMEIGRMNSTTSFLNLALGRSPLRPSVVYAETNHLVISVQDFVTKQIVEQHGGTISVFSKGEGEGSVFTVRLPCIVGSDDGEEDLFDFEQESKRKLSDTKSSRLMRSSFLKSFNDMVCPTGVDQAAVAVTNPSSLLPLLESAIADAPESVSGLETVHKLRVLVVDDSDMNRKMVCKVLSATNEFYCEQAVDGSEAVEMVRRQLSRRTAEEAADAAAASTIDDEVSIVRNYSSEDD